MKHQELRNQGRVNFKSHMASCLNGMITEVENLVDMQSNKTDKTFLEGRLHQLVCVKAELSDIF